MTDSYSSDVPLTNARGGPLAPNLDTAVTVLETRFRDLVWFDEFLNRLMTGTPPREWSDADDLILTLYLQRQHGVAKVTSKTVHEAIKLFASKNRRNCVKDWLQSLTWDDEPRINDMFSDHFGAPASAYTTAVSKNFWLSMVARIYQPGCQVDNMIVLEGKQGTMKSSALRIIGGEWFCEQHESATKPKAFAEIIQGKLLIEISEMDSFDRSDVTSIKQIITCVSDRYRAVWGHYASDYPRQCVFAGTTNRDDWNKDDTGARRFWPIRCNGVIDTAALTVYRSQYFAEAVHRFNAGESWWVTPYEPTKIEQDSRYIAPAWLEPIERYLEYSGADKRAFPLTEVTVADVLESGLQIPKSQWSKAIEMRIASCLRLLHFSRITKRIDGKPAKIWIKQNTEDNVL